MRAVRFIASMLGLVLCNLQAATPGSKAGLLLSAEQLRLDESSGCYSRMLSGPELGPLIGKVQLPMATLSTGRLDSPSKPTAAELLAIQRWRMMSNECLVADFQALEAAGLFEFFGPVYSQARRDKAGLLSLLAGGEMSYAEFNDRAFEMNVDHRNRLETARESFRRHLYHVGDGAPGYPLWEASDLVPRSREQLLLSRSEQKGIDAYRRDPSYATADLFLANTAALNSNVISVNIDGKTYRIVGSRLGSTDKASWLWTEVGKPQSQPPATALSWPRSTDNSHDFALSGQVVVDGKAYDIVTIGRFQVLLHRH